MSWVALLSAGFPGEVLAFAGIGALVGGLHFTTLRWNTRLFLTAGNAWRAVAMQLARMAVTASALFACALAGAIPLTAALAGMLLARRVVSRKGGVA
jgi:hypothetical protein